MSLILSLKTALSTNPVTGKLYYMLRTSYIKFDQYKLKKLSIKEKQDADMSRAALLKNTKLGKRCFIIGNGPSLRISDLDRLINEDCFAVNRIYQIFDQTKWRPTYYVAADRAILAEKLPSDLHKLTNCCEHIFLSSCIYPAINKKDLHDNVHFAFINAYDQNGDGLPAFSEDVVNQIYHGSTVIYICIQLAIYMGYSEIYLLGIDHNYSIQNQDGRIIRNKSVQDHMTGLEGKMFYLPELDGNTRAFQKAREVSDRKGIVIKNATRGGKLEVFERVAFDTLVE